MQLKALVAIAAAACANPAEAAEWWWFALNGQEPNRVATYLDRESIVPLDRRHVQVVTLAIGESAAINGVEAFVASYSVNCRKREMSLRSRIGLDQAGKQVSLVEVPPAPFAPIKPGSVGESFSNFACGRPSGSEVRVASPRMHSQQVFHKAADQPAAVEAPQPPELSLGTGFFVGANGLALTSYHVVENAKRIACRTIDGEYHAATIERASVANDLALLRVATSPKTHLDLAPLNSVRPGDRVFTVGYGAATYLGINEARYTEGSISALSGLGAEDSYMQISVPIQPGNSGGPLVNESGQVVGIIASTAAIDTFAKAVGTLPQSVNWAVKADYAAPLVGSNSAPGKRSRQEAISNARNSLCLVVADPSDGSE